MIYSFSGNAWEPSNDLMSRPYFEALDGNWQLVDTGDRVPDGGRRKKGINDGIPLLPDYMPTRLQQRDSRLDSFPMLDVHMFKAGLLVSQKFKDTVESLEPNCHQFFPMHVTAEESADCGTYYYFNICKRLDTLHPSLCTPRDSNGFPLFEGDVAASIVFAEELVAGNHAWMEKMYKGFFVSDELHSALRNAGLSGIKSKERKVLPLEQGKVH